MSQEQWLACTPPSSMLQSPTPRGGPVTERKFRLFAVACCRRIWHLMTDERTRRAVEVAEGFADSHANRRARKAAEVEARNLRAEADAAVYGRSATASARPEGRVGRANRTHWTS